MFYTYILYSKSTDAFYKGSTQSLSERLRRHNLKMEKATQAGTPWILLWSIPKTTKGEAQILEYKLKNLSRKRTCDFMLKYDEGIGGPDELLYKKQFVRMLTLASAFESLISHNYKSLANFARLFCL